MASTGQHGGSGVKPVKLAAHRLALTQGGRNGSKAFRMGAAAPTDSVAQGTLAAGVQRVTPFAKINPVTGGGSFRRNCHILYDTTETVKCSA